jgi:hypothetical protein
MLGKKAQQESRAHGKQREAFKAPQKALHASTGIGGDEGLRKEPT